MAEAVEGLFGRTLAEAIVSLEDIERAAQVAYNKDAEDRAEVVALGFKLIREYDLHVEHEPDLNALSWVRMTNSNTATGMSVGEAGTDFTISGDEVRFVLRRVEATVLAGLDMSLPENEQYMPGNGVTPVVEFVLWHSHYRNVQPSKRDIAVFPTWLARCGVVYHAPSRASTRYTSAGEFEPRAATQEPYTTEDNA